MNKEIQNIKLLDSIRSIITDARRSLSRQVNFTQIISNWLVGRIIVEDEQKGEKIAQYGKFLIKYLSDNLTNEFGSGYDQSNLRRFRSFYLLYPIKDATRHKLENLNQDAVRHELEILRQHTLNDDLEKTNKDAKLLKLELQKLNAEDNHPLAIILNLNLSWTHHRILLKVNNKKTRDFYLQEAHENNWSTRALDRQVNTLYYERIVSSQNRGVVKQEAEEKTKKLLPEDLFKDPMVLEFLQLKKDQTYLESELEEALLNNLNSFLLELGKGFAFVARQKHIRTQTKDYYIDLVFYNYLLKCFVLIDLKTRELNHGDIGQMDMYVRYFEDKEKTEDDQPTIGIIMATEKDETVIKYSVLNDNKQLFATKYKLYLPSTEELKNEIEQSKLNYKLK